jgi:prevent-host-death family protein
MTHAPHPWSVAQAKARFSEVLERARAEGPQFVTRNGRDAAVIVSAEAWAKLNSTDTSKKKPRGSILDVFAPIRGAGLDEVVERMHGAFREVELGDDA